MLSDAVRRALILKANAAYLSQPAPTPPATTLPAGLLNLPLTTGGVVSDDLDAVIIAVATIEDASGSATHILCSPSSWADLSKFKLSTSVCVPIATTTPTAVRAVTPSVAAAPAGLSPSATHSVPSDRAQ
jgi:hypothetical protein